MIVRFIYNIIRGMVLLTAFAGSCLAAASPAVDNLPAVTSHVSSPVRLAVDQFMHIYLTDPRGGGINKYDRTGKWIAAIPVPSPQGVAVTDNQDLVVSQKDRVSVVSGSGSALFTMKDSQGSTFVFQYANGVAIDPVTGNIFVSDSLADCILVFDRLGQPITTGVAASGKPANSFGSTGTGNGQFSMPTGLAFEKKSRQIAVADTFNGRVQFFDLTYSFQKSIGSLGSGQLSFTSPEGLVFEYTRDASQNLYRMYVLDSFQSRVQVIDPGGNGTFLKEIGGYGRGNGKLRNPSDVVFDNINSRLIVANGIGSLTAFSIDGGATPVDVDVTPPSLTAFPASGISTNQSSVTFSGTVETGALVTLTADTAATTGPVAYSPTNSIGTSTWNATVSNLASGANIISIKAYDSANNPATLTRTINFSAANAVAMTINPVTTPTNSTSQTLSGTIESGGTVTVNGAAATVSGTFWSFAATLAEGANFFTIAGSLGGKTGSTLAATINVVLSAPEMHAATLVSGSTTATQLLTVRGTVAINENFDRLTATINNGSPVAVIVQGETFAYPVLLNGGTNTVATTVYDKAGNSATDSRTITFDPTNGRATITATTATDGSVTSSAALDLSGTMPTSATSVSIGFTINGTPTTVQANLGPAGTWSATGINLDNGINAIQATAMDGTNPLTSASLTVTRVAADMPTITVNAPANDLATDSTDLSLTGIAGAAAVTVTMDGSDIPVTFIPGAPATFTLNRSGIANGVHLLALSATDAFGNTATAYRSRYVKTSPPAGFSIDQFAGQSTTLNGTLEPGATIFVKRSDGTDLITPLIVGASGSWTITLPSAYDPATMNLFGLDQAGNSTRNGRLGNDNSPPDITDAIKALQIAMGRADATPFLLLRGDVAPLVNGVPTPDGVIDSGDVLIILRKLLGFINF
ncbi:E3 ubiquitin-protein ligase TRIM71 [Geobacter sp. OR-1]|uniref:Ig-like domain-containing protein n=1 Tax=Geobacter sp. OR-1 TaxID=1266765 RepID=UPI0005428932|nr:Ig-like domain-containing protein [Geobacter sp. OR-1]GAM07813.1 E3 ubiquitin-protein ligase TRIM71 [Geobacter sp. OR-1]